MSTPWLTSDWTRMSAPLVSSVLVLGLVTVATAVPRYGEALDSGEQTGTRQAAAGSRAIVP